MAKRATLNQLVPTDLYRWFGQSDELLYVGISQHAFVRASQHRNSSQFWPSAVKMTVQKYACRADARAAEDEAILKENPLFNKQRPANSSAPIRPFEQTDRIPLQLLSDEAKEIKRKHLSGALSPIGTPKYVPIVLPPTEKVFIRSQLAKYLGLGYDEFDALSDMTNCPPLRYCQFGAHSKGFHIRSDNLSKIPLGSRYIESEVLEWVGTGLYRSALAALQSFKSGIERKDEALYAFLRACRIGNIQDWRNVLDVSHLVQVEKETLDQTRDMCRALTLSCSPLSEEGVEYGVQVRSIGSSCLEWFTYCIKGMDPGHMATEIILGLRGEISSEEAYSRSVLLQNWFNSVKDTSYESGYTDEFDDIVSPWARNSSRTVVNLLPCRFIRDLWTPMYTTYRENDTDIADEDLLDAFDTYRLSHFTA